jgi:hypothetical protein
LQSKTINRSRKAAVFISAALLLLISALVFLLSCEKEYSKLVVRDQESGKIYASFPCPNGTQFSVEFTHSVNKSPVIDVFEVNDGVISVVEARYYTFGAGMPFSSDEPGWTFTTDEDGTIIVTGIGYTYDSLNYIVGTVYDHILTINGESINLRELCSKNAKISISQE